MSVRGVRCELGDTGDSSTGRMDLDDDDGGDYGVYLIGVVSVLCEVVVSSAVVALLWCLQYAIVSIAPRCCSDGRLQQAVSEAKRSSCRSWTQLRIIRPFFQSRMLERGG